MTKVQVFDENGKYVTMARYNEDLDIWDGDRFSFGFGFHLGITKLRDGRYALICGEEYPGGENRAEVVSDRMALAAIIGSGHDDMLYEAKYERLKTLADNEGRDAVCPDILSERIRQIHQIIDKRRMDGGRIFTRS